MKALNPGRKYFLLPEHMEPSGAGNVLRHEVLMPDVGSFITHVPAAGKVSVTDHPLA